MKCEERRMKRGQLTEREKEGERCDRDDLKESRPLSFSSSSLLITSLPVIDGRTQLVSRPCHICWWGGVTLHPHPPLSPSYLLYHLLWKQMLWISRCVFHTCSLTYIVCEWALCPPTSVAWRSAHVLPHLTHGNSVGTFQLCSIRCQYDDNISLYFASKCLLWILGLTGIWFCFVFFYIVFRKHCFFFHTRYFSPENYHLSSCGIVFFFPLEMCDLKLNLIWH